MGRRTLFIITVVFLLISSCLGIAAERVVDLTAADGTKLKATFFAAAKAGPGVLLLHQCNKDRKIWDGLAQQLANSGINVLTFDLRGFGDSEGKPFDKLTPQEAAASRKSWPSDIDKAYEYLLSQPGVKREAIGVGGASCGVHNSVQTAIRHPEIKSLVLLAGTTDLKGREFLRNAKNLPILFGYADDDEFPVTITTTQWLYAMSPNSGDRLVRYDKGGHGAEIFAVHPEFMEVIRDWYVTTLIKTPGEAPEAKRVQVPKQVEMMNLLETPGGTEKLGAMLRKARAEDSTASLFPEAAVNALGYEHLQSGDVKGAVEILKLNAEAYPDSANAYDSVSDAYLAAGQKEKALETAKKALAMLDSDKTMNEQTKQGIRQSAEQKIKQLGDMPK